MEHTADEAITLSIVPDHFGRRARAPLQHASLLPAPGAARAELNPPVVITCIDHSDSDDIAASRRAMLERDLHPEHVPRARVELQLVVVAEPVVFGSAREGANRRRPASHEGLR